MDFKRFIERAKEVKYRYVELNKLLGQKQWGAMEYTAGLVGDVGDLMKLIMAAENFRKEPDNLKEKIKHELIDCLWSVMAIADELGIDLQSEFFEKMDDLERKIYKEFRKIHRKIQLG